MTDTDVDVVDESSVDPQSAYARIGGQKALIAVVERFYTLVMEDPELAAYFKHLDAAGMRRVRRHQVLLFSTVLGGPPRYDPANLGPAHQGLHITPEHYKRVVNLLAGVLFESNVPEDIIMDAGQLLASLEPVIAPGEGTDGGAAA